MGKCIQCGKEFPDTNRVRKYCSIECSKAFRRAQYRKKREEREALKKENATVIPHSPNGEPMNKTKESYCKKCVYFSSSVRCCNYFIDTGLRRECPVGWCDKYERKKRNKKVPMNLPRRQ